VTKEDVELYQVLKFQNFGLLVAELFELYCFAVLALGKPNATQNTEDGVG